MSRTILLLGANGQIGQALCHVAQPQDWTLRACARAECDVTDYTRVQDVFEQARPDLVVNAAAMTHVDACEGDAEAAREANFLAPGHLATLCAAHDVPLIHLSTDYVFDGQKDTPYTEEDPVHPLNTYGFTKMLGEDAVRGELAWHVILRISWVFGPFGTNVLRKMVDLLGAQPQVRMVRDQTGCPTPALAVARTILQIGARILGGKTDGFGTFHYCGAPAVNRYEFALAIAAQMRQRGLKAAEEILPITSDAFPTPAARPACSALDCARIKRIYGIDQPSWSDGLTEALDHLNKRQGT